ncbi:penicillin-binding protein 1B [Kangiella sediminilitoris]|uniref:Penicillin-binding protein 1B n=1 Tax=Kangiella sediminilitoris TaxID=1144748 RepID=A0A1B3BD50_9GAMM|nr:penicillin-binding protein 1B [Kangiella sediminilitoris]AOE50749.1 Penicillin-binding protein 1B [Kangiella sediminilitoris]
MSKKTRKKTSNKKNEAKLARRKKLRSLFWKLALIFIVVFAGFTIYLDSIIQSKFKENRWELPARVYAQSLDLANGKPMTPTRLRQELELLGYRKVVKATRQGDYENYQNSFFIYIREFQFWDSTQPALPVSFNIKSGRIKDLKNRDTGESLQMARLDPLLIGQFHPNRLEDRILVHLDRVPDHLKQALLAVEDRDFYEHSGVSVKAVARALWHNVTSDGRAQGGSTITQQLVKNYFLTNERTLWRKFKEAIMSVILEVRYEKEDILQAYFNEVYFGQDGGRAIHGVGLASQYFFDKRARDLTPAQSALLVGMLKSPTGYNPRRNKEASLQRRNQVLKIMYQQKILTEQEYKQQRQTTLSVVSKPSLKLSRVPAFMDLVRRQLQKSYSEEELRSEGLRIFTTLDPVMQRYTEEKVQTTLERIELMKGIEEDSLQTAVIITSSETGNILALVGDRYSDKAGFNRAIDAKRQIGSVIKPYVVLAALEKTDDYNLATIVSDEELSIKQRDGTLWVPRNYDRRFHGEVPLFVALMESYNIAMARLGQLVGIDTVAEFIEQAGVEEEVRALDALPLGVLELTPIELAGLYQSLASGGLKIKPSAITAVTDNEGSLLERYPIESERIASELNTYLVKAGMQLVVEKGTARYLHQQNPFTNFAGKTGTTNDLKDSWFAGFSGEHLAVVWVGRDDNKEANITGSSAALPVFTDIFNGVPTESLRLGYYDEIEWKLIDPESGLIAGDGCIEAIEIPFIRGTAPEDVVDCNADEEEGFLEF